LLQSAAQRQASSIAPADLRARAQDALDQDRRHWHVVSPAGRPAFLTLALIAPLLARSERSRDPAKPVALSPWRRQWLIWRAARRVLITRLPPSARHPSSAPDHRAHAL